MFERILRYFEQKPMRERRECKMQNFISFLMVLFFETSKIFLREILSFIKNVPPWDELSLAGYAHSSVPGELNTCSYFNSPSKFFLRDGKC